MLRHTPGLVLLLLACGPALKKSDVPTTPMVEVDRATVHGVIRDPSGIALEGVQVVVAETDDVTLTDATGAFTLSIPADTTVTLRALKPIVYTSTTLQSFVAPAGARLEGLDVILLAGSTLGAFNQMVNPNEDRAVVAVNVVSVSGRCSAVGATVALTPAMEGTPFYVRTNDNRPDGSLRAIQADAHPQAWVISVPPTTGESIAVTQSGCRALTYPVSWRGVTWQAPLRLTKGLTQTWSFLE